MTAAQAAGQPRRAGRSKFAVGAERSGSLVTPFVRHLLLLIGAALATYLVAGAVPADGALLTWLGAAAVLGLVAGLIGRRPLGVLFVVAGMLVGLLLHLHLALGSGEEALHELAAHATVYGAALGVAVVAYLLTSLGMMVVTRQGRTR